MSTHDIRIGLAGLGSRGLYWLDLLKMVTTNPAHALQQENKLGRIAPGYLADAIAIPYSGSADMVHDAIVENRSSIEWMIVDGKLVK